MAEDLYENRRLSDGYPDLARMAAEYYFTHQEIHERVIETVACLGRLIDMSQGPRTVAVVGCGPNPASIAHLLSIGFDAVGVEPTPSSAETARQYLGDPTRVVEAGAESLPFAAGSQQVVVMESVLEHVDSPFHAASEAYRVLLPGGVLYIYTTNRLRFSPVGANGEFRVPFYNWLSPLLKESYVFHHLHYDPRLANYTTRPAVHWFTYAELCQLGRQAGFGQFYSPLDLLKPEDPSIRRSRLRQWLRPIAKRYPWLRAMALRQFGNAIFMWKRP